MTILQQKTVLITGGSSGIGLATAHRFIKEGARVAITGTSKAKLLEAARALGGDVLTIEADAGNVPAQAEIAKEVGAAFGKLDILFVNAGIGDFRPLEDFDEESFDRSFAVNVKGPFFLAQALLPFLNNPASIVLNGSINARIGMPNSTVYSATKAALISMARTLSGELIGRGVRVNVVSPGPVETPLYNKLGLSEAALKGLQEALISQLPVGRFGKADEIADAVVYFASDLSRFVVGSELVIDGGMTNL